MSDTEAKKHKASDRKVRKKREEGSVPQTRISVGLISAAAGILVLLLTSKVLFSRVVALFKEFEKIYFLPFDEGLNLGIQMTIIHLFGLLAVLVGIIFLVTVLMTMVLNKGIVFSMKPVTLQLNRVSPMAGFKNIFGKRGWIETGMSVLRTLVWLGIAGMIAWYYVRDLWNNVQCTGLCLLDIVTPMFTSQFIIAIAVMIVFAGLDVLLQKQLFMSEQKMTDTEQKRERKDQFGSPEIRQARSQVKAEMAMMPAGRLSQKDATIAFESDVGIVAINFNPPHQGLPLVVAKAKTADQIDKMGLALRRAGVPLLANVRIVENGIRKGNGDFIDVTHFNEFAKAYAYTQSS